MKNSCTYFYFLFLQVDDSSPPFIGACVIEEKPLPVSEDCLLPSHLLPTQDFSQSQEQPNASVNAVSDSEKDQDSEKDTGSYSNDDRSSDESMQEASTNEGDSISDSDENLEHHVQSTTMSGLVDEDSTSGMEESDEDREQGDDNSSKSEDEGIEDDESSSDYFSPEQIEEIDDATDCDGFKMNFLLNKTSYDDAAKNLFENNDLYPLTGSIKRDVMVGKKMAEVFMRGGFQKIFGAACSVYVPSGKMTLSGMQDRFSVKKGNFRVNKQVPKQIVGQEMLLCIGPVEIALWPKSVDMEADDTTPSEDDGKKITCVRVVEALKFLGYPGAELNPKCASTHKILKQDCLRYSTITLFDMLTAVFASRPYFFSICGLFGARVKINDSDGAFDNLWFWKQHTPQEFRIAKHLVRLDLAYSIPITPKHLVQVTGLINGKLVDGVNSQAIFSAEAIGSNVARASRIFYSLFTPTKQRTGGVEILFPNFFKNHSPSQVAKIKIYNTVAHIVKQVVDPIEGDRNIKDQLADFTVEKMQNSALSLLKTFHKSIDYINEYGTCIRLETTSNSCYNHPAYSDVLDRKCVELKFESEVSWMNKHYWAIHHFLAGNFNVEMENVGRANSLLGGFYRGFTLLQIVLRRRQHTFLRDLKPKETNLIYIAYLYAMLRSFAGYAGSRHYHAIKSYTEAPFGTYPDFSGTLFLMHMEKESNYAEGYYIDPIRHTPTEAGDQLLRFEQRFFLMTSMAPHDEQRALRILNQGLTYREDEMYMEMSWLEEKLKEIVEQRQHLLAQALDKNAFKSQELKDLCGKHYLKIGLRRLQSVYGLNIVDKQAALAEGSAVLMYNLIPFKGLDATETGFKKLVASIGGVPTQSSSPYSVANFPYLQEQIDTLDALAQQVTYVYQDIYEPLPTVSIDDEDVESSDSNQDGNVPLDDDENREVNVPTLQQIVEEMTDVKGTEGWCKKHASCIIGTGEIFEKVKYGRFYGGVKLNKVDEDTPMIHMEEEVAEALNALYSYLGNKNKMSILGNRLNISVRDLQRDKNATAMDILDLILACYKKKYPDIDQREVGVNFGNPEDDIDDSEDEEYENRGYGENGDKSRSEIGQDCQDYLDSLEERRASYSTRARAGNQSRRNEWVEVHAENQQLQNIMNDA